MRCQHHLACRDAGAELNDEAVYKIVPYEEFDTLFSAYQRKNTEKARAYQCSCDVTHGQAATDDLDEELKKPKELSIVDARRHDRCPSITPIADGRSAQNCNILLSKLRVSNREIRHAILSMDEARSTALRHRLIRGRRTSKSPWTCWNRC